MTEYDVYRMPDLDVSSHFIIMTEYDVYRMSLRCENGFKDGYCRMTQTTAGLGQLINLIINFCKLTIKLVNLTS